tara:strand:+ start:292 stop:624 length:333 start_codon:yes stop_codon:yes gene_type:complete
MSESFLDAVKQRRVDLSFSLLMSNERALHVLQHAAEDHILKIVSKEIGDKHIFGDKEREELKSIPINPAKVSFRELVVQLCRNPEALPDDTTPMKAYMDDAGEDIYLPEL